MKNYKKRWIEEVQEQRMSELYLIKSQIIPVRK